MANARTITNALWKQGYPVSFYKGTGGIYYFVFDDLKRKETKAFHNYNFDERSIEEWISLGVQFAKEVLDGGFNFRQTGAVD
jgi:hypothetical protein